MDPSVVTWIVEYVIASDDEDGMKFVLKMMSPQHTDDVTTLLQHCVTLGAPRCLRALIPLTGPKQHKTQFFAAEWDALRTTVVKSIARCNASVNDAIMTVLDIAWLTWTQHMRGLLLEAIQHNNWPLALRLVSKGYMEGNHFGKVLIVLWDVIEHPETTQKDRDAASNVFDALLELLRDSKDESMLDDNRQDDSEEDDDGEEDDERDESDVVSLTDGDGDGDHDHDNTNVIDDEDEDDDKQAIARRVRHDDDQNSNSRRDTVSAIPESMLQFVKGLFIGPKSHS